MVESKDDTGRTALMIACSENESPDIAKMLVEHGALISVHDNIGKTPVFEAGKCILIHVNLMFNNLGISFWLAKVWYFENIWIF